MLLLATGLVLFWVWLPATARTALWEILAARHELVVLLLVFVLLALSLVWSAGQQLDSLAFLFFNRGDYHPGWLDGVMWLATQLGSMPAALIAAGFLFVLLDRKLAITLIFGTITLWLLVETIKLLTDRARPFLTLEAARIVGRRQSGRSFPSGHTAQAFFLATLLTHQLPLEIWQNLALYAIAALVGLTRIYVGAHYPRDVIGGAVLGAVWGFLGVLVEPSWIFLR